MKLSMASQSTILHRRAERRAVLETAAEVSGLSPSLMAMALAGLAYLPREYADAALESARQARVRMHNEEARRRSHR